MSKRTAAANAKLAEDALGSLQRIRFEDLVQGVDEWCKEALIAAGYDAGQTYQKKRFRGRTYYAHHILKYLGAARDGIERGHSEYAAIYALKLGLMIREYELIGSARRGRNAYRKDGSKPAQGGVPRGRPPQRTKKALRQNKP